MNLDHFAAQWRAARALIDWSQSDLAEKIGVAALTIKRLEYAAEGSVSEDIARKARAAFEAAGVEFIDDDRPGVRMMTIGEVGRDTQRTLDLYKQGYYLGAWKPVPDRPGYQQRPAWHAAEPNGTATVQVGDLVKLADDPSRIGDRSRWGWIMDFLPDQYVWSKRDGRVFIKGLVWLKGTDGRCIYEKNPPIYELVTDAKKKMAITARILEAMALYDGKTPEQYEALRVEALQDLLGGLTPETPWARLTPERRKRLEYNSSQAGGVCPCAPASISPMT
jgi:transcriptional regulator with XRE-family HTH domain